MRFIFFCGILFIMLFFFVPQTRGGAFADVLATTRENKSASMPIKGKLLIYPLDNQNLVVIGNYNSLLSCKVSEEYGKRLTLADTTFASKKLPAWSHRFWYNYAVLELAGEIHPVIQEAFDRRDHFLLNTDRTAPLFIKENGSWINAVGLMRLKRFAMPGHQEILAGDLMHFAYFRLNRPLENGEKIKISTKFGEFVSLTYNDQTTISRAIKINQVGYLPDAGQKYAYLGMWEGSLGELPVKQRIGEPFYLREKKSGKIVFTGKLALRSEEQTIRKNNINIKLNGETVLELDFSSFQTPGSYYIQIPGVGRSWDFLIGNDAVGRSFYIHMRGLFHQRSGIAKPKQYTDWNFDTPDHVGSWRGGFTPNDREYAGKGSRITDAKGKNVSIKHFDMIRATATEEFLPNVSGGWWDAGDFDRRTYHFRIIDQLLSVYLLFPQNFTDGQLDIPESGNGIPDIIDEAAWGMELWRKAQNPDGGVGCWLEATSHPVIHDPGKDDQRYYLALPTRESTLEYAIYAAKLVRAYLRCGQKARADLYRESALRAWDFAMNPKNRIVKKFKHPKLGELTYTEPETLPEEMIFKAALNLYLLTDDEKFDKEITDTRFKISMDYASLYVDAYYLCELQEEKKPYFLYSRSWDKFIWKQADSMLLSQNELAYRNVNWRLNSAYFTFLAWGNALPLKRGAFFLMAWQSTGEKRYRDAALLLVDWMQGTNPMGRSMTTGLGTVYPVRFHCLFNTELEFADPVPGITPYIFTGSIHYSSNSGIYALREKSRKDHRFTGFDKILLPRSICPDRNIPNEKMRALLEPIVPLWRRHANLEGLAVDQNEYTVWETIAPAAAACAALLPPGWKPPKEWHSQKQTTDINALPGYIYLP